MLLALLAFLGGALTIISPCILPVLPSVFAWGRSFARGTLPLLAGMAVTFAVLATLAAVGGAGGPRERLWPRIRARAARGWPALLSARGGLHAGPCVAR
jgi:cytochrome c biogenesis protein CcdA